MTCGLSGPSLTADAWVFRSERGLRPRPERGRIRRGPSRPPPRERSRWAFFSSLLESRKGSLGELAQILQLERLGQDRDPGLFEKSAVLLGGARDEDHPAQEIWPTPFQLAVEFEPIQLGHEQIAEDEFVGLLLDLLEREPAVGRGVDLVALGGQHVDHHVGDEWLIVNHQYPSRAVKRSDHGSCPEYGAIGEPSPGPSRIKGLRNTRQGPVPRSVTRPPEMSTFARQEAGRDQPAQARAEGPRGDAIAGRDRSSRSRRLGPSIAKKPPRHAGPGAFRLRFAVKPFTPGTRLTFPPTPGGRRAHRPFRATASGPSPRPGSPAGAAGAALRG